MNLKRERNLRVRKKNSSVVIIKTSATPSESEKRAPPLPSAATAQSTSRAMAETTTYSHGSPVNRAVRRSGVLELAVLAAEILVGYADEQQRQADDDQLVQRTATLVLQAHDEGDIHAEVQEVEPGVYQGATPPKCVPSQGEVVIHERVPEQVGDMPLDDLAHDAFDAVVVLAVIQKRKVVAAEPPSDKSLHLAL
eukprot:scaffold1023_cov313-Pinguiococcus_pyrenoidosus.AAC.3